MTVITLKATQQCSLIFDIKENVSQSFNLGLWLINSTNFRSEIVEKSLPKTETVFDVFMLAIYYFSLVSSFVYLFQYFSTFDSYQKPHPFLYLHFTAC